MYRVADLAARAEGELPVFSRSSVCKAVHQCEWRCSQSPVHLLTLEGDDDFPAVSDESPHSLRGPHECRGVHYYRPPRLLRRPLVPVLPLLVFPARPAIMLAAVPVVVPAILVPGSTVSATVVAPIQSYIRVDGGLGARSIGIVDPAY